MSWVRPELEAASVLRTFAELAKSGPEQPTNVLRSGSDMEWLSYRARFAFSGARFPALALGSFDDRSDADEVIGRLIARGQLHQSERLLRVGWMWLAGTVVRDGTPIRYCFPLVSVPIGYNVAGGVVERATEVGSAISVWAKSRSMPTVDSILDPLSDFEVTALIDDASLRWDLEETADFADGLKDRAALRAARSKGATLPPFDAARAWCERAAAALGLTIDEWMAAGEEMPAERSGQPGIAAIAGYGIYLHRAPQKGTKRAELLDLAAVRGLEDSAFAALYDDGHLDGKPNPETVSLRPLSSSQRSVATRAGSAPLAAVSGAPGTGKTHVLSVIAMSAVARGESVLMVASSDYSVDVLLSHLADTPGLVAVTFGGSRHAERLSGEMLALLAEADKSSETMSLNDFVERRALAERTFALEVEALRQDDDPVYAAECVTQLDQAGDLDELGEMIHRIENPGPLDFWLIRARAKLRRRLGSGRVRSAQVRLDELMVIRDARRLLTDERTKLPRILSDLVAADDRAAVSRGDAITQWWLDRVTKEQRSMLSRIAQAQTAARSRRRSLLGSDEPTGVVRAAPLWVSAAHDIEEIFPRSANLFDLVIIDESAQISQTDAAAALVRAKRAVVCGDPHQLGQTSFLTDDDLAAATTRFDTDPAILDLRTNSIYDVAAIRTPVHRLEEHFRSAPHLIEFSSRRFYDGSLKVATRHPVNEAADHVHIEVVPDGARGGSSKKVNHQEVARCLAVAQRYIEQGCTSIGFMSPFRTQADALEAAVINAYSIEEIDRYGLRVGTVHGFQGDERDVVILSWAVGPNEGSRAWNFVNQPDLFNVMVTRGRRDVVVVTSVEEPPGLAGQYVRWAEPLEDLVPDVGSEDPWVNRVAQALREQGVPVRVGYRVGVHVVDIVVGAGRAAIAVECGPHPDGMESHLDRAMLLYRMGWRTVAAYKSKWDQNPGQFAIELTSAHSGLNGED